jgi:hypothetical protein
MRTCCRCNIKMVEGFDIKVEGGGYVFANAAGITIIGDSIFNKVPSLSVNRQYIQIIINFYNKITI